MKEKKNIERLFQEQFKDFEAVPPQDAWANIEARLDSKKRKRRIIPFWLKASGVAALLAISLGIYFNQSEPVMPNGNEVIVNDGGAIQKTGSEKEKSEFEQKVLANPQLTIEKNTTVTETNSTKTEHENGKENKNTVLRNTENTLANTSNRSQKEDNTVYGSSKIGNTGNVVNHKTSTEIQLQTEKIATNQNTKKETTIIEQNPIKSDNSFEKENQKIVENITIVNDSARVAASEEKENELEKLLEKKEEGKNADEKEKEKRSKWAVSTNAAPVYFNSLGEGSSLEEQFASNSKSYNNSLSYGVGLEYALNERLSVKSGVNRIELSYATNDVYYKAQLNPTVAVNDNILKRVNYQNIELYSKSGSPTSEEQNELALQAFSTDVENVLLSEDSGRLEQVLGYYEVPVELSYKLINKKISVNVIGGVSTFFLNDNNLTLYTEDSYMNIGKANNLNDVSFSGNFGLGVNYSFWKSFDANFQPMLKYQFDTFSSNNNFQPYFIGLYTGISYKF